VRDRQRAIYAAILAVVCLAVITTMEAITQVSGGGFRPLRFIDIVVIIVMFLIVTLIDLVKVSVPQTKFNSVFGVSGAVFVATTIGYGAIVGIVVTAISTLIAELFARREPQKLVFNVAQLIATTGLAGITYQALAGGATGVPLASTKTAIAALIASVVYLAVNNILLSLMIGTAIGKSPVTVFLANSRGQLLQNVTLPPIGLLLTTVRELSPLSVLIALIPLLGPYVAMRGHREILMQIQRTIEALADTVDRRDITTAQHSERVAAYTQQIIEELGTIRFAEAEAIILAARVHDLGKIAIPDAVLLKPGKLDDGEYWLMRQHPAAGDEILQKLSIYKDSLGVVRHHHERYDGRGYPDGLKGEEIPLGGRIVAGADSYDVMTSDRPYARARTVREGIEELIWCKGTHFDPTIVDAFVRVLNRQHNREPASVPASASTASPVSTTAG
jgi:HD-GYP domain-containing protein (c-di-GMP phosphodiesterase class II)